MSRIPPRSIERQPCDLDCSMETEGEEQAWRARVRNLSLTGARIEGPEVDDCPDSFELRIVHESGAVERLSVHVIWRSPGAMGVRFEVAEKSLQRRPAAFSRAL